MAGYSILIATRIVVDSSKLACMKRQKRFDLGGFSTMKQAIFCIFLIATMFFGLAEAITRIACVGDNITYGVAIRYWAKNSFPNVLGDLLGGKYSIRNFDMNGADFLRKGDKPYWKLHAFEVVSKFEPKVVIINLGTNDAKPQNRGKSGEEYEADLRAMISHFQKLPSKPSIYLYLRSPVYQTRWGINEKTVTGSVIPIIRKVSKDTKLPIVDLYQALSNKPEMFPDEIHPDAAGARVIAKTIFTILKKKQ